MIEQAFYSYVLKNCLDQIRREKESTLSGNEETIFTANIASKLNCVRQFTYKLSQEKS